MRVAYVDSSCLVAVAFDEPRSRLVSTALESFELLMSSNLLEAELRSALVRERVAESPEPLLDLVAWVIPDRPLHDELTRILTVGYLRGADLWHLACALMLKSDLPEVAFLTLDDRQARVAAQLGFPGLDSPPA